MPDVGGAERRARVFFVALLEAHGWCIERAARAVRVPPSTLTHQACRYAPEEVAAARADGRIYHGGRREPCPAKGRRGDDHPARRLTARRVAWYRRRYAAGGRTIAALARTAGVSHVVMAEALRGVTWRRAGGPLAPPRVPRRAVAA